MDTLLWVGSWVAGLCSLGSLCLLVYCWIERKARRAALATAGVVIFAYLAYQASYSRQQLTADRVAKQISNHIANYMADLDVAK